MAKGKNDDKTAGKAKKTEKVEKVEKAEKVEKTEKAEKAEKTESVDNKANDVDGDNQESMMPEAEKLLAMVASLDLQFKELKLQTKNVVKEMVKNKKILKKEKARKDKARESPSGFAKPTKISDEMCDFMKIPHGSERSRTDVTRSINQYIKTNNLNNPTNKRYVIPDATLKKLLNLSDTEQISFFHMQRYLSPHVKKVEAAK